MLEQIAIDDNMLDRLSFNEKKFVAQLSTLNATYFEGKKCEKSE